MENIHSLHSSCHIVLFQHPWHMTTLARFPLDAVVQSCPVSRCFSQGQSPQMRVFHSNPSPSDVPVVSVYVNALHNVLSQSIDRCVSAILSSAKETDPLGIFYVNVEENRGISVMM